jgi:hypothetical protein
VSSTFGCIPTDVVLAKTIPVITGLNALSSSKVNASASTALARAFALSFQNAENSSDQNHVFLGNQ